MRVFPLFAFFFEQAKIIAPLAKARLVSIVDFVRVHNLRVFQDFFLNHFYDAVFLSEQISVIHIRNLVNVKKSSLRLRHEIIQAVHRQHDADIFPRIFLPVLFVMKKVRRERHKVVDVQRIYLIKLNQSPLQKKQGQLVPLLLQFSLVRLRYTCL